MTFIRKKSSTYKWPVKVSYPVDEGRFEVDTFDAVFKRIGRSEFQRLADSGDTELIEAVLVGWEKVADEAGKELPFNSRELRALIEDPCFTRGVIRAYLNSLDDEKKQT
tara:strand:- start:730 stop:1056 length:327 start_codon:yes stop_codon:yes gene_type:complete